MDQNLTNGYAGDKSASECFEVLASDDESVLVDVRTTAEWNYVGVPDLSEIGKVPIFLEWQIFPAMSQNTRFAEELRAELDQRKVKQETPIFFICRSGVRSMNAAILVTSIGFKSCCNVLGGFEGPVDESRHRGNSSGWKAERLPWIQS